ncbi:calpain-B-like [Styela clava]
MNVVRFESRKMHVSSFSVTTKDKTFQQIRNECIEKKVLFEDDEFPATDSSLASEKQLPGAVEWKRPKDLCDNPKLFIGGTSRLDVKQGFLGDTWLSAALTSLATNYALFRRVMPGDQSFAQKEYAGIFHFQFWQFGKWVEVLIDDRLPVFRGRLLSTQSTEKNEFWPALLEKAYAKLFMTYGALEKGTASEAMEDFTGGITQKIDLRKSTDNVIKDMQMSFHRNALMCCAAEHFGENQSDTRNGLKRGHYFAVTGEFQVKTARNATVQLVRVRNPGGKEDKWTGEWADEAANWRLLSDSAKREMKLAFDSDGEFWMSFEEFTSNFTVLEICRLEPITNDNPKGYWKTEKKDGQWIKGFSAGGNSNFPDTFHTNPQYFLSLDVPEDSEKDTCAVVISLVQKDRRWQKIRGLDNIVIGFEIYKANEKLDKEFFLKNKSNEKSDFLSSRSVTKEFSLPPGEYVIVPSTLDPDVEGKFLLRIFTETQARVSADTSETKPIGGTMVTEEENSRVDEKFRKRFESLAGGNGVIDAFELKEILTTTLKAENVIVDIGVVRALVATFDKDEDVNLDFEEFKKLWTNIRKWIYFCEKRDPDKSNDLDVYELRDFVRDAAGISLSNGTLSSIYLGFRNNKNKISFSNALMIASRLTKTMEKFKEHTDVNGPSATYGKAVFTLDDFLSIVMRL